MAIDVNRSLIHNAYHNEKVTPEEREICLYFAKRASYMNKIKIMKEKGCTFLPYTITPSDDEYGYCD